MKADFVYVVWALYTPNIYLHSDQKPPSTGTIKEMRKGKRLLLLMLQYNTISINYGPWTASIRETLSDCGKFRFLEAI